MPKRERWLFRVELPPDVTHGGRFMARLLKHLLRAWGVKCVAVLNESAKLATATHQLAQAVTADAETGRPSSSTPEAS